MNKESFYMSVSLIILLLTSLIAFYLLSEVDSSSRDIRPIPKRIIVKDSLKIIEVKDITLASVAKRPEVAIQDIIPKKVEVIVPPLSEELIQRELQEQAESIVATCVALKQKNKAKNTTQMKKIIKKELLQMQLSHEGTKVFLVDYDGNILLGENTQEDINARTILLEEVHKVRRYGKGFIVSTVDYYGLKRYIYVKKLGMHKLFIGVDRYERGIQK